MKLHLMRGKNFALIPLVLIDKSLGKIAQSSSPQELEKLHKIALNWIRRTIWKELGNRNDCEYEKKIVPLTKKEFNWLKERYDQPI